MPVYSRSALCSSGNRLLAAATVLAIAIPTALAASPGPGKTGAAAQKATAKPAKPAAKTITCTFAQCFRQAMARSPLIAAARTDIDKYAALAAEADSALYPTFNFTAFGTIMPTLKDGRNGADLLEDWDWNRPRPYLTGQLSFTQALWTFGKIDALQQMAKTGVRVGKTVQEVAKMEMHYQLSRAWWTLVLADELDGIIREGERQLNKERKRIDKSEDDDDFDPNSRLQLRMLEADFEKRVRVARRTRALAEDAVRMALNEPSTTIVKAKAEDGLEPVEYTLLPSRVYEELAIANHPRLAAKRGGLFVKLQQVRYERNKLWPDVVLVGRFAYTYSPAIATDTNVAENPTNPTVSGGGVALRWRLDFFRQFAKIDKAEVAHRRASLRLQADKQKMRLQVRKLYRELRDAKAMVDVYDRAMRAARGWLRTEEEMQGGGFSEYRELARSLEQFYRRKLTWLETIHRHNVLVADLSRAVGTDITKVKVKPRPAKATAKPAKKPAAKAPAKSSTNDDDGFE